MSANPSPASGLLPHLIVKGGAAAIAFYQRAFGAELVFDLVGDDGRVGHAEMKVAGACFMLADEFPEMECLAPTTRGGTSVGLALYVHDVDTLAARAVEAGAVLERPVVDEFYGDRVAHITDPFGHRWTLHTRVEDVSPEEMRRRMAKRR